MLVHDGKSTCTCFMYLDRTPNAIRLVELWKQTIVNTDPLQDQVRYRNMV